MRINVSQTVRMTAQPKITVSKTTEDDIKAMESFFYPCDVCGKLFEDMRSVECHKRWCLGPGTADARSRAGSKAGKKIKADKRATKIAAQAKIKLNDEEITNVGTSNT